MHFNLRKYSDHASCTLESGNTTLDFGLLDRKEAQDLMREFQNAVEELEWFLQVTEK